MSEVIPKRHQGTTARSRVVVVLAFMVVIIVPTF